MKHLQNYESFDHIDEGWKENLLYGTLLGLASFFTNNATAQRDISVKNPNGTTTRTRDLKDSSYIKDYIREGWTLDSVKIDTLFKEVKEKAPKTNVFTRQLKIDKNSQFNSGDFSLSQNLKSDIDSIMDNIANNKFLLLKVEIVSSTDKQAVGPKLQEVLKNLGYTQDNAGLSKARSTAVSKYLQSEFDLNDSLITTKNLVEQGGEIDKDSRYVVVNFYYLEKTEVAEKETSKEISSISKTYVMKKTYDKPDGKIEKEKFKLKLNLPNVNINIGKIFKFENRGSVACPRF